MPEATIYRGYIWEDAGCTFLARIRNTTGSYITQATLSSIAWKVFDLDSATPNTATASGTCTIASTVYDSLQTEADVWTKDGTGYNWKYTMAASNFPDGNNGTTLQRRYRVEFLFTPTSGEVFYHVVEPTARLIRGS
jgi:hypothetical protein